MRTWGVFSSLPGAWRAACGTAEGLCRVMVIANKNQPCFLLQPATLHVKLINGLTKVELKPQNILHVCDLGKSKTVWSPQVYVNPMFSLGLPLML